MATPWPQVAAWPNDLREHATYLSDYLRKALACINSTEDQPVPNKMVKTMIAAMSVLITKFQNTPDMSTVIEAIAAVWNDLKTTTETIQFTVAKVEENTTISQETNQTVKDAAKERRSTNVLIQETNDIAKATNDITKAI
jgi:hypothetical protein